MCNADGSVDNSCDENGRCSCNSNVIGEKCDKCAEGYATFPSCDACAEGYFMHMHAGREAHPDHDHCEGECKFHKTKKTFVLHNIIFFPACQCNAEGAVNNACADGEGQCTCKPNITGDKCDKCAPGFFGFPNCQGMINHLSIAMNS